MYYCPHCSKPAASDHGACPHCGKELAREEQPAGGGGAGVSGARQIDPATGEVITGGAAEIDLGVSDESIDLDFDPRAERSRRAGQAGAKGRAKGAPSSPVAPGQEKVDEVASLAGFGPAPEGFFQAVTYMLHVRKRRSALRAAIVDLEAQAAKTREALDRDLVLLGQRKIDDIGTDADRYAPNLRSIRQAQGDVDSMRSEKTVEDDDMKGKESYVNEEIANLQKEAEGFKQEERILEREIEDANTARKRVQLRLQRIEIEIRNTLGQIPRPRKGEPPPDPAVVMPLESKVAGLEEVHGHIERELKTADQAVREAEHKLALARNAGAERMGRIELAGRKKMDLAQAKKVSDQLSQARFYELQGKVDGLFKDLAQKILADDSLPPGSEEQRKSIEDRSANLKGLESKLDLHKTAIDCYSHRDYVRGQIVLFGGSSLVLLLILVLVALLT